MRRTVLFAKPDVVILLDQVRNTSVPSSVSLRFFPDNRDDSARLELEREETFIIHRPKAWLYGRTSAKGNLILNTGQLDLPDDLGAFPYVQATSPEATGHEIVTVLIAQQAGEEPPPDVAVQDEADGWRIETGELAVRIDTSGDVPDVGWS